MSLVVAWLVFPLLLCALTACCGLLVERLAGIRLPGVLLIPLGLALIVVATQAVTYWDTTAELATPLVLALALAGLVLSRGRIKVFSPERWALAAAAGVFAVFAAPVVFSGDATFAGYTILGDTSIHFVLIDRLMSHGHSLADLAPSSYQAALHSYIDGAYPVGAHTALGAVRPLVGQDVAWVFQPFLAFLAVATALSLYALLAGTVEWPPLRAAIAFLAAQPALVLAYALQGSIKEMATVWAIALTIALVPIALGERGGPRRLVPLALAAAAGLAVLGLAIAVWVGPLLAVVLLVLARQRGREEMRLTAGEAAAFAAVVAAISFPVLAEASAFVRTTEGVVTAQTEFGNLIHPLRHVQVFGIWPSGDYRLPPDPDHLRDGYLLIGVAMVGAVLGVLWALRRRAWLPILYLAISLVGWAYVARRGSPWADAKALMIVSTPVMVFVLLGAMSFLGARRRLEASLFVAAVAFGVLWSNALAYHDVRLAPRDRMQELRTIGERIDGEGPTLYTEFEEFAKHFLRSADPTGWSESWQQAGAPTGRFGFPGDVDEVPLSYLNRFHTLVLRRSPSASRPPASFRRTYAGRYYEIWQRQNRPAVLVHVPFGDQFQPGGDAPCPKLRDLARQARTGQGRLAYVERPPVQVLSPTKTRLPRAWTPDSEADTVHAIGAGTLTWSPRMAAAGRYEVWIRGSFGRATTVSVDGRTIGRVSYQLNGRDEYAYVGQAGLASGTHLVTLSRGGGGLHPGNGGDPLLGPVVLAPAPAAAPEQTRQIAASGWRGLCGRRLDWAEVVRG